MHLVFHYIYIPIKEGCPCFDEHSFEFWLSMCAALNVICCFTSEFFLKEFNSSARFLLFSRFFFTKCHSPPLVCFATSLMMTSPLLSNRGGLVSIENPKGCFCHHYPGSHGIFSFSFLFGILCDSAHKLDDNNDSCLFLLGI